MNKQREALELALAALCYDNSLSRGATIVAVREALAEPDQEPVAWMCADESLAHKGYSRFSRTCAGDWNIPVYTTSPPARKPLTDAEIDAEFNRECWVTVIFADGTGGIALDKVTARDFARAIERAHGIGGEE